MRARYGNGGMFMIDMHGTFERATRSSNSRTPGEPYCGSCMASATRSTGSSSRKRVVSQPVRPHTGQPTPPQTRHSTSNATDGSVKGIPGDDAYPPGFDKQGKGLVPVPRLEHYKDFYFANLDPNAQDLHTYLAGAKDYIDLVVDQSPSGKMEIISGVQEYDIKANWKLLVENSVDDYHLVTTHSTWLNYMRNSGVNVTPAKGHLLPTKGFGKDLGNGHLTTDNPNYRGRPVAKWIAVYGEEAKADIDAIRKELVERINLDIRLHARMQIWLYLHVPLTLALLAALLTHVISVFLYW